MSLRHFKGILFVAGFYGEITVVLKHCGSFDTRVTSQETTRSRFTYALITDRKGVHLSLHEDGVGYLWSYALSGG